ncbi:MAG: transglycosylase SLT domain-containing protein [Deltaproteobacteria bacterium]|nr:transglycosylase SLT domain-containing protein [Deltaproteobacteria bacterium]
MRTLLCLCLVFISALSLSAFADIYRYVDKNGVWHFTNVPTQGRYRLFIKTGRNRSVGYVNRYIKTYESIIAGASNRFGVESSLIKAVIKAESDFDHYAVSRYGAQGLMQLMPQTADDMEVKDPFNPAENIFGGTRYLKMMLTRFNNNLALALSAYNAGPENVEKYHDVPPFPETRAFIKRVLRYYRIYKAGK